MLSIIFLIPLIFAIFLVIFFREKVTWWEYLLLVIPSFILSSLIYFGMISHSKSDVEYLGDYVVEIRYYEPWDEYIQQTCTRTYTTGSGDNEVTHTETYDCSYVSHHKAEWFQVLSNGNKCAITKEEYNRLFNLWAMEKSVFVDMPRKYHRVDGDMYYKRFDGIVSHSKTVTFERHYENKVKASRSIFGFTNITKDDAKKIGLHDYPPLTLQKGGKPWGCDKNQNPFLGYTPNTAELTRWQFINGYYGSTKQIRVFLLFFYNEPQSIMQDQRDYWVGGNKNEMVLCFGMDSITKKIHWADAFSWSDKPTFEVNFRNLMSGKSTLDLFELADFVEYGARNYWVRKKFEDFKYLSIELTGTQLIWLFIIILIFNASMSAFIVLNKHTNK